MGEKDTDTANEAASTGDTGTHDQSKHSTRYCTISCKFEGKDPTAKKKNDVGWVRCCLCTHWYHPVCVQLPQDQTSGVWSCPSCRNIASEVSTLKETVKLLLDIVRRSNSNIDELLMKQIETLNAVKRMQDTRPNVEAPAQVNVTLESKVSLLIGDSLIRNTKTKSKQLRIKSNVFKLEDISKQLQSYDDLDCIYIVNGTNDCKDKEPTDIINLFKIVISEAKKIAKKVVISSITPRTDNEVTQQKVSTVNQMLVVLTNDENVTFVNNDDNFTYRNQSADKGLLQKDGYHLSHEGITRLISNLKLQDLVAVTMKPSEVDVKANSGPPNTPKGLDQTQRQGVAAKSSETSGNQSWYDEQFPPLTAPPPPPKPPSNKRKIFFQGYQHPLSNFFPCNIELYDQNFASSEAAYQYRKAVEYEEWDAAEQIVQCSRAFDAKKLGDDIKTDQKWWDMRLSVMMEVLTAKSKQCPEFKNTLMASDGNELVEDTQHEFWARGRHGKGQNKLGRLLESLRSKIPSQSHHQTNYQKAWNRPSGSVKRSGDPGCGFCGEKGHSSEICGHGRPIQCRNCKGYRHKEKKCWYKGY